MCPPNYRSSAAPVPTIAVEAIRKDVAYLLGKSQIWRNLLTCKFGQNYNFAASFT